ncbi:hypothetical protein Hanom_Chr17g01533811 [Helianthus anomalus]
MRKTINFFSYLKKQTRFPTACFHFPPSYYHPQPRSLSPFHHSHRPPVSVQETAPMTGHMRSDISPFPSANYYPIPRQHQEKNSLYLTPVFHP